MGPEFPLTRSTAVNGQMVTDPLMSTDGDPAPRPGDALRTPHPGGVVGRADMVADRGWAEGELLLNQFNA